MSTTATYSPEDNKLRLRAAERLPADLYARVKEAGYTWAPKQALFVAPMWTPEREDLALELAGEIGDEDTSLVQRAEERAERFEEYGERRAEDGNRAAEQVKATSGDIPFGQPILIGHHSERRARKDAERIEDGMRRAVKMWETSAYWERRAQGAIRAAKYKERPDVRARRIKKIEADKRKQEKYQQEAGVVLKLWSASITKKDGSRCTPMEKALYITNYFSDHSHFCFPLAEYPRELPASQYEGSMSLWSALNGGIIGPEQARALGEAAAQRTRAGCQRWLDHYANRLVYERAMMAEAGGTVADRTGPAVGGACRCWASPSGGWSYIQKVNKVSVVIHCQSNYGPQGENEESKRRIYRQIMPLDKLSAVLTAAQVQAHKDAGTLTEAEGGTGFFLCDADARAEIIRDTETIRAERLTREAKAAEIEALKTALRAGVQVVVVADLFATPPDLARQVVELADIQPGNRVLEPSAGTGNLLKALKCRTAHTEAVAIELNPLLCASLRATFGAAEVRAVDFLSCNGDLGRFDRIIMNPPFSADILHIQHARTFLKPGGRLVALCANGPRQRERLMPEADQWLDLPPGSFKESGTNVNAAMVVFSAPAAPKPETTLDSLAWESYGVPVRPVFELEPPPAGPLVQASLF